MTILFPVAILTRLREGHTTAVEVMASRSDRRAWVCIDPLPYRPWEDRPTYREDRSFDVQHYEVDAEHIGQEYEIPDSAIHDVARVTVLDEQALHDLLIAWGVPIANLTAPWRCGMVT